MSPNELKALIAQADAKAAVLLDAQAQIVQLLTEIRDEMRKPGAKPLKKTA